MTETLPGAAGASGLQDAVNVLMAEAEQITSEIATLRCSLELAEHKRHKLVTALSSAVEALPKPAHEELNHRMNDLANAMSSKRGRRSASRRSSNTWRCWPNTARRWSRRPKSRPISSGLGMSVCPTATPPTP